MPCPRCGGQSEGGWKFCHHCGQDLRPGSSELEAGGSSAGVASEAARRAPAAAVLQRSLSATGVAVATGGRHRAPERTAAPASVVTPEADTGRRSRRPRWLVALGALAVVATLAAFAALGLFAFNTHSQLDDTTAELLATSGTLEDTRATLSATEADLTQRSEELVSLQADLDDTAATLDRRTAERDEARDELDAAETEIAGLQGSLDETQGDLATQQQRATLQSGQIAVLKDCLAGVSLSLQYLAYEYWDEAIWALEAVEYSCDQAFALF
ncbi:MAG: hypothetical protein GEU80_10515 [Dehalococcoidia bacterium]|nr:hypothetical protein [Dehalococcoidia bacterium]